MKELHEFLREKGFAFKAALDGQFERIDRNGTLNAWFIGRQYAIGEKTIHVAKFGDWRTSEEYEWKSSGTFTPAEQEEIDRHLSDAKKKENAEREALQIQTATECQERWNNAIHIGRTPYTERKKIDKLHGARIDPETTGTLLVPAKDVDGKLWGLQKICADGSKFFHPGMRIRGCFHLIGDIKEGDPIYVSEGYATAGSIFQATGQSTVAAFNAGNLEAVAGALSTRYPSQRIIICGDVSPKDKENPGTPDESTRPVRLEGMAVVFASLFSAILTLGILILMILHVAKD